MEEKKQCPRCKRELLTSEFYTRRRTNSSTYCKTCINILSVIRQRDVKKKCVEYKGGECKHCGYKKYVGALEFHHIDPSQKDFSFSQRKSLSFNDLVKKELDKCILLCSNCHKELHAELRKDISLD